MQKDSLFRRLALVGVVGAATLTISSLDADAISRYKSRTMTCSAIKETIRIKGAVLFEWESRRTGNPNYNRFVRNAGFCNANQTTTLTAIPASNTNRCSVPYCVNRRQLDPFD